MNIPEKMNERIRFLRIKHGYTQQEIINILGVGKSAYSMYENGERTISVEIVAKLAQLYNVTTDFIIGLTNNTQGSKTDTIEKYLSPMAIQNIKEMVKSKNHTNLKALNSLLSHHNSGQIICLLNNMIYTIENKK